MMKSILTMLLKCYESVDSMSLWYSWIHIRMWYDCSPSNIDNSGLDSLEDLELQCGR